MKNLHALLLLSSSATSQVNTIATTVKRNWLKKMRELLLQLPVTFSRVIYTIREIGVQKTMDDYERRKLGIFNLLNFLQLITGLIIPVLVVSKDNNFSDIAFLQSVLPCFVSLGVLMLNYYGRHEPALLCYFILYPIVTSVIYLAGMNLGIELFFVLYGILSVFFIQHIGQMIFALGLSMVSYFVLTVLWKNYHYELANNHTALYIFNHLLAVLFIFYGLYLIKKENTDYQFKILGKGRMLHQKNLEINKQKKEIENKASLLEKQATELAELNGVKNKLFSVIAHDLRTPMYALRNLFQNVAQRNLTRAELKTLIPEVTKDLSFTTDLIENLLHWAKNQMQAHSINHQPIDISGIAVDVLNIMRLQLKAKNIEIDNKLPATLSIVGDRDMVQVVLRNLVSNAIKFTPINGRITIGVNEIQGYVEVYIRDTGVGITPEGLQKIRQNIFFSTKGTTNESGTGLGLMLCREFILKNGGHIYIESEQGGGTTISFTLPRGEEMLKAV